MDHLSLDDASNALNVKVPCVYNRREDDWPPFAKYPGVMGWTLEDVNNRANWSSTASSVEENGLQPKTKSEAEELLQSWLYFGLLRTFFDDGISPLFQEVNYENGTARLIITTRFLPQLLALKRSHYRDAVPDRLAAELALQSQCLDITSDVLTMIYKDHSRIDSGIVFSIAVLGHTLESFISRQRFARARDLQIAPTVRTVKSWPLRQSRLDDLVTKRLREVGWCPNEIRRICRLAPSSRFQVSQVDRPHPEIEHGLSCSDLSCSAYNLNKSTYVPEHVCDSKSCSLLTVDGDEVYRILKGDQIPVVVLRFQQASHIPELAVYKADEVEDFVAISHVWSDKLGNVHANSMPLCQVQRLAKMVSELFCTVSFTIPFWIDTLCCPVKPNDARYRAIRLMGDTYSKASKVLVVEKYITRVNTIGSSVLQRFLRIYCSTWVTRLWTLQEGIFAKSLYFQFRDRAVSFLEDLNLLLSSDDHNIEAVGGLSDMLAEYAIRKLPLTSSNPYLHSIAQIQKYLYHRRTSHPADEAWCVGNLLGQDITPLLGETAQDRMYRFWRLQKRAPGELIFLRRGARYQMHGLRWAPTSFMIPENDALIGVREKTDRADCPVTPDGLVVQYAGVLLPQPQSAAVILPAFYIKQAKLSRRYFVKVDEWVHQRNPDEIMIGRDDNGYATIQLSNTAVDGQAELQDQFALIIRAPLESLDESLHDQMGGIHVALVRIVRQKEDIFFTTFLTAGLLLLETRGRQLWPQQRSRVPKLRVSDSDLEMDFEDRDADSQVFEVQEVSVGSSWCVG